MAIRYLVIAYTMAVACVIEGGPQDQGEYNAQARLQGTAPAPEFTLCLECFCADGTYAPIGTHCGVDGNGRCRSGKCSYRCGSYDGNCGPFSSWAWEAAAGCVNPCGDAGMCPHPAEPTDYCDPWQPSQ